MLALPRRVACGPGPRAATVAARTAVPGISWRSQAEPGAPSASRRAVPGTGGHSVAGGSGWELGLLLPLPGPLQGDYGACSAPVQTWLPALSGVSPGERVPEQGALPSPSPASSLFLEFTDQVPAAGPLCVRLLLLDLLQTPTGLTFQSLWACVQMLPSREQPLPAESGKLGQGRPQIKPWILLTLGPSSSTASLWTSMSSAET